MSKYVYALTKCCCIILFIFICNTLFAKPPKTPTRLSVVNASAKGLTICLEMSVMLQI